jgi:subtilisin family serine protease
MKQSAGITPVFQYVHELPYATRPVRASSLSLGISWLLVLAVLFGSASAANGQSIVRAAAKPPASANSTVSGTPASTPSATAPAAVTAPTAPAPAESASSKSFVPGHILVQPRPGLSNAEFDKALAPHGGKVIGRLGNLNVFVVALPPNASEQAVASILAHNPHFKFAEVDQLVSADLTPNDAYFASEWHLQTVDATSAWNSSTGYGITVAILDSGIDATHPDLQGQLVPGWNFYDNNSNTSDVYGHGTKVAGVVAALGNNGMGVAGIAWNAKVMPVRVSDTSGVGTWSAIASGLNWAADRGAKVANLSFAVQSSSTTQTAAQYFRNKGGVVVNSAGNYGVLDPTAASDALVSVSATDSTDTLASWSSYGPYVDLSAPGVGIWTTTVGGGYGAVSGTSFSSPLTAGVAALMMAANPALSPSQIVSLLKSTAVDLGATGSDYYFGSGRVNAGAAVLAAVQARGSDTAAPAVAITAPTGGTVSGVVPVNVSASDNIGVVRVDLYVNGSLFAGDATTPYGFSWDSTAVSGPSASLVARAYDAAGNWADSSAVIVGTSTPPINSNPDTVPPTVAITDPANGSNVRGQVNINVASTDNVGVANVRLYLDGAVVGTGNAASLAYRWNASKSKKGLHTISAVATDTAGNQATSSIQVTN